MPILAENEHIPLVFASRHGDVELTLSLLQSIANNEPLSPTSFSLAVHNAISGFFQLHAKIEVKRRAISATENLIPFALLEAATQLQDNKQVLCIICESPIPEFIQTICFFAPLSYAIAMVLSREEGDTFHLKSAPSTVSEQGQNNELEELMALLYLIVIAHASLPLKMSSGTIER